jgi:hypothetical protein
MQKGFNPCIRDLKKTRGRKSRNSVPLSLIYHEIKFNLHVYTSFVDPDPDPQGSVNFTGSGSVTRGFRIRVHIRKQKPLKKE